MTDSSRTPEDPGEVVPTDNSTGAPLDPALVQELEEDREDERGR
jgi:hypothetical protein